MKRVYVFVVLMCVALLCIHWQMPSPGAINQGGRRSLNERLGYSNDAKLLIVHADDLGATHSVNAATLKAFETGLINSGSMLVPCREFPAIADYARKHPEADLGIHLALTSDFEDLKPVLPKSKVPSLVDKKGYFYYQWIGATKPDPLGAEVEVRAQVERARLRGQSWTDVTKINPREVEAEIRAQIARAYKFGVKPTHLDSHQARLYRHNRSLLDVILRVAREYKLPINIAHNRIAQWHWVDAYASLKSDNIVLDKIVTISPDIKAEQWENWYVNEIKQIVPGVTEFLIHLAYDDEDMRAFTHNSIEWGAKWRQRDLDFFTSDKFRQLLKENNIKLVTWRQVRELITKP